MSQPTMRGDEIEHPDAFGVGVSAEQEGAPLRRGPVGLLGRLRGFGQSAHVRLWAGPTMRLVGIFLVLSCVAFIGSRPAEEQKYGSPIRVEEAIHANGEGASADQESPSGAGKDPVAAGERPTSELPASPCQKAASTKPSGVLPDGRIILNEATLEDLTRLPGVGESRAQAILDLRTRLGRFRKVSDLLRVRGIGWKTLKKMSDLLVVDRPPEEKQKEDVEQKGEHEEASGGV